jgi:probable phosphoglycerate mutase
MDSMFRSLILVRHGESEHHVNGLTGGWTDTPLTEKGREQAALTAGALESLLGESEFGFYTSDLLRAKETADIIGARLRVRPVPRPELRELNNGIARGKSRDEAKGLALPVTEPTLDWVPYPEAESWRMMSERVFSGMDAIAEREQNETVLVVSHGNALVAVVHWWLGLGEEYWSRVSYEFGCGSITRLMTNVWRERSISCLNDTCHLVDSA